MNIVLEESDETLFWLELIQVKKYIDANNLLQLITEANELTSIFVSSLKTMNLKIGK
jgi:four helix bundle protein